MTGTTGITIAEAEADPQAQRRRENEIKRAADTLDDEKMIRYDPASGMFVLSMCAYVCICARGHMHVYELVHKCSYFSFCLEQHS
jgi:hypothetical protein